MESVPDPLSQALKDHSSRIRTFYSAPEYNILCTLHFYTSSTLGSNLHLIIQVTSRVDLKNVIYSVSTLGSTLGMSSFLANAIMIMVLWGTLGIFPTLATRVESPYTTEGVQQYHVEKIITFLEKQALVKEDKHQ